MENIEYSIEGKGKIIVLIHGLSDNLHYWDSLTEKLKDNYRIIRYNLRGHGNSDFMSDTHTWSMDDFTDDLKNILDYLDVDEVNLVGFSLGGAIALNYTIKYPDKVSSLTLMSTFSHLDQEEMSLFKKLRNALDNGFEEFFNMILPMIYCPKFINKYNRILEEVRDYAADITDCNAIQKAIDAILSFNIHDKLEQISIPTLVLAGRYDDLCPMEHQQQLHENIRNSQIFIFDNVKHNLLVEENVDKISEILERFLLENPSN